MIKKIDLHIHTIAHCTLDKTFSFSLDRMKEYIKTNALDVIAITNHNCFDVGQFASIRHECESLHCVCLPGIEISLENGHVLVIGDATEETYSLLQSLSQEASPSLKDNHYSMVLATFNRIIAGHELLIIPHYYGKTPSIAKNVVKGIECEIVAGEAGSQKKFFMAKKKDDLTPVCFSDIRICEDARPDSLANYNKVTYIKTDEPVSVSSLKKSLKNKANVSIGRSFLDGTFDILDGRAEASTGINVLIGERSSGKTFSLERIFAALGGSDNPDVLYIRQFQVQDGIKDIKEKLISMGVEVGNDYCVPFQKILTYMDKICIEEKETKVTLYLDSLKKHAESCKEDEYSKAALYSYSLEETYCFGNKTKELRAHVEALLDIEGDLSVLVNKHLEREKLIALYNDLLVVERRETLGKKVADLASEIAKAVSDGLSKKSVSVPIEPMDYLALFQARYVRKRFDDLVGGIHQRVIREDDIFGRFTRVISAGPIPTKQRLKSELGIPQGINVDYLYGKSKTDAYLRINTERPSSNAVGEQRWRYFLNIKCEVKNKHGADLSGGQSAEYFLLEKLHDYRKYQYVLIDELEPSFDNPFLNGHIVGLLKEIAESATVFISTHNNNLGVSLNPDQYIFHKVDDTESGPIYTLYYGSGASLMMRDRDGKTLPLSDVLITTMEAGADAYEGRKNHYENIKN